MRPRPPFMVEVIAQIRAAIDRVGWSETARLSRINRTTLHRCFGAHGRGHPNLETIERVLPHLGLKLELVEAKP